MQNNICIIGVELIAQKVFLSQKFTCRDICGTCQLHHRWCFAWNDARHWLNTASVHRYHELARPAAALLPYFEVNLVQICAAGWQKVWKMNAGVSFQKVDCRWAGTLPCWKIKNSRQICGEFFKNRLFQTVWPNLDTPMHHYWLGEGWVCLQQTLCATCLFLVAASA